MSRAPALLLATLAAIFAQEPKVPFPKTIEEAQKGREEALMRAEAAEKDSIRRGIGALDEARVLHSLADTYSEIEELLRREATFEAERPNLAARREAAAASRRRPASGPNEIPRGTPLTEEALAKLRDAIDQERTHVLELEERLAAADALVAGGSLAERERLRADVVRTERLRRELMVGASSLGPAAAAVESVRLALRAELDERSRKFLELRDRVAPDLAAVLRAEVEVARADISRRVRQQEALARALEANLEKERAAAAAQAEQKRTQAETAGRTSDGAVLELEASAAEARAAASEDEVRASRAAVDSELARRVAEEQARFRLLRGELESHAEGEGWIESWRTLRELRASKEVQDLRDEERALRKAASKSRAVAASARKSALQIEARLEDNREAALAALDRESGKPDAAQRRAFVERYDAASEALVDALGVRAGAASRFADLSLARASAIELLLESLDEAEKLVRIRGLFVRVGSQIDFESAAMAVTDFLSVVRSLPGRAKELTDLAGAYLTNKSNLPRVVLAAILLPVAFFLVLLTRRVAARLARELPTSQGLTVVEWSKRLGIVTAQRMAFTVFLLLALIVAMRMFGASPALLRAVDSSVLTILLVRLGVAIEYGILRPDDKRLRLLPVSDGTAHYVNGIAILFSLGLVTIAVPRQCLEAIGYGQRNPGFLELMKLAEHGLVTAAVVMLFARASAIDDLLPKAKNPYFDLGRNAILRLRSLVLFFAIAIFAMRLMGYPFLARMLASLSVGGTAIIVLVSVANRAMLQVWEAMRSKIPLGPPDGDMARERRALLDTMVRVLAPVTCIVLAWFAFVAIMNVGVTELKGVDVGVVGGRRFRATDIVLFVAALVGTFLAATWIRKGLTLFILPITKLDVGTRYALAAVSSYLMIVGGLLASLGLLGLEIRDLAIVLGAAGFGIGLGMQESASNFLNGLILLFSRPVKVGDVIESEGRIGEITDITITTTRILTPENYEILIPNREIVGKRLVSHTGRDPRVRVAVRVGVAYGSDPGSVREAMLSALRAHKEVKARPEPMVQFLDIADSALVFELRYWIHIDERVQSESDVRADVLRSLEAAKIDVPFPQRDLNVKGPVAVSLEGGKR